MAGNAGSTSEPAFGRRFSNQAQRHVSPPAARSGSSRHAPLDGVSVWYVWHTEGTSDVLIHDDLTATDMAEFAMIRNPATRRRSLATRALLRRALSEAVDQQVKPRDWVFGRDRSGKPHLLSPLPNLHFNCSHTPFVSVVAVSRSQPVGIDIEPALPAADDPTLIEEFFATGERKALRLIPSNERAQSRARLWSLKEAVVKMLGTGLALDVTKLEFDTEADHLISSRAPEVNASGLRLASWSIPNKEQPLSVALAVKN